MSSNLEYRARERQRKRESGRQASEAQREKGRQRSRARDKKQRRHFSVGRTTWKFCSGGDKMRNASGHQSKMKMSGSEKKKWTRTRRDISSKQSVTSKKFLEVSRCSRAKERQKKMYKSSHARMRRRLAFLAWGDFTVSLALLSLRNNRDYS